MKVDSTDQDVHQKSVVLHGRDIAVFGSSNWTGSSSDTQREHNYFTRKTWFVDWFAAQFLRKWNNLRIDGTAISPTMFQDLAPGWPEPPVNVSPANGAFDLGTSVSLRWEGGWWAHSTTSISVRPILRRSWRRTTCPARRPRASVRKRNHSIRARLLRLSSRSVRQG